MPPASAPQPSSAPAADGAAPIYVTRPAMPPLEEYLPYLRKIWSSCTVTNGGPFHAEFERALSLHLGVGQVSLFANGTIALVTALQAMHLTGEVITTPFSFVATTHALRWGGITPVFADIDPLSMNLDPARIEAAITPRTTAILAVHCFGYPCATRQIQAIARRHGLKVIYDAAHAFGVNDQDGSILNHGDLSVLSFHGTKVFHTFEGGAIISHDTVSKQRIDHLKNFGFVDETTVVATGINGKMNEACAALGLLQLRYIGEYVAHRAAIDAAYREGLRGIAGIHCPAPAERATANHSYFPILVNQEHPLGRDGLYQRLRQHGIHARRYFHPLISQFPLYSSLPSARPDNLPVATSIASQVLCLPIYPGLAQADLMRIIDIIRQD